MQSKLLQSSKERVPLHICNRSTWSPAQDSTEWILCRCRFAVWTLLVQNYKIAFSSTALATDLISDMWHVTHTYCLEEEGQLVWCLLFDGIIYLYSISSRQLMQYTYLNLISINQGILCITVKTLWFEQWLNLNFVTFLFTKWIHVSPWIIESATVKCSLTSLAVQFYLGFCYKSGTLVAWLASCQCLCISSSANDSWMTDKTA